MVDPDGLGLLQNLFGRANPFKSLGQGSLGLGQAATVTRQGIRVPRQPIDLTPQPGLLFLVGGARRCRRLQRLPQRGHLLRRRGPGGIQDLESSLGLLQAGTKGSPLLVSCRSGILDALELGLGLVEDGTSLLCRHLCRLQRLGLRCLLRGRLVQPLPSRGGSFFCPGDGLGLGLDRLSGLFHRRGGIGQSLFGLCQGGDHGLVPTTGLPQRGLFLLGPGKELRLGLECRSGLGGSSTRVLDCSSGLLDRFLGLGQPLVRLAERLAGCLQLALDRRKFLPLGRLCRRLCLLGLGQFGPGGLRPVPGSTVDLLRGLLGFSGAGDRRLCGLLGLFCGGALTA